MEEIDISLASYLTQWLNYTVIQCIKDSCHRKASQQLDVLPITVQLKLDMQYCHINDSQCVTSQLIWYNVVDIHIASNDTTKLAMWLLASYMHEQGIKYALTSYIASQLASNLLLKVASYP